MSTAVGSKEEILKCSRELVSRQGWASFNIRELASDCGMSVGSIYYYFSSKVKLMADILENIWTEVFLSGEDRGLDSLTEHIVWLSRRIEYGINQYPGFFAVHMTLFNDREKDYAIECMNRVRNAIVDDFCKAISADRNIRTDAFNAELTERRFCLLIFNMMFSFAIHGKCATKEVLEIARRSVY